ncbi:multidrug efflux system membrane fusion protein [Paraburkholderia bannensis]|uniref:Multidrug efflux system membrane fusion protein n=1 Tax=Paraburkholderia bannensis TaxID=765414 RepID=A0A7W9U2G2_9BURK|nr:MULTISPECIES: MdtA/MuxA family multidrug efflux RND transporter periplasmic adaptor subunit [Paraburkholderia]MBB3260641.1 multidrug efflux system membrane fusion protein [Paraburkholderia sp. WP4_3_2]MBB6105811.1 multidrug efflux system membrane fusion protein [Paraburkholderia bannensis]
MDKRVELPKIPDETPANEPHAPDEKGRVRPRRVLPWVLLAVAAGAIALFALRPHGAPSGGPAGFPGGPGGPPGAPGAMGGGQAQAVGVAAAATGDVPVRLSSLGTVTSLATVTVKSQISGYLQSINFREGQHVKKGDVLAQVDPRQYQVALKQYQGQVVKDKALLDNARLDLARYQRLAKTDSVAQQTLDTAEATVREYEGTVLTDEAQVDAQQLNLTYCRIVSPVDGRVGLRQVDVGNYVTASDTDGVVVVTETDPISVVFTLPEDDLRRLNQRLASGARLQVVAYDRAGEEKLADGVLDTVDNQIDTTTGTVKLRALFKNADGALFPNQFVNISLLLDTLHGAVTIPSEAVQTGTPGTFVYRVNDNQTVSLRKIRTGAAADGHTAVLAGLAVGDRVVIDGADHLSDGSKIRLPNPSVDETAAQRPARAKASPQS